MVQRRRLTNELREMIISKFNAENPFVQIANELELNSKTVATVIRTYKQTNRISSASCNSGRKKKIGPELNQYIQDQINLDVSVTLKTNKQRIQDNFGTTLSVTTVNKAIENFKYTWKRIERVPAQRNSDNNIRIRQNYASNFMSLSQETIIYIDETGFNCGMRTNYGRSLSGTSLRKNLLGGCCYAEKWTLCI